VVSRLEVKDGEQASQRVRVLRKKLKWSQRKLAKRANTSQQQIQRIETEQRSVRIDLALRICSALSQPLATVFPKTARTVAATIQQHGENPQAALQHLLSDRDASAQLQRAGVAADLLEYEFALRLRVARTGSLSASTPRNSRDCGRYCRTTGRVSIWFRSLDEHSYLVNCAHLLSWHFERQSHDAAIETALAEAPMRLWFVGNFEPDGFDVTEDEPGEDGEFAGDLDHICGMLDGAFVEDLDFRLHFLDDGGDAIWFNPADVALIAINEEFIGQRDEHGRPIDPSSDHVIGTAQEREREGRKERPA
jgi:transcriptional regulator with XRE-family HTH domain